MRYATPGEVRVIAEAVAHERGIGIDELLGPIRKPHLVEARDYAMGQAHDAGATLDMIAQVFDREHSTVRMAVRRDRQRGLAA